LHFLAFFQSCQAENYEEWTPVNKGDSSAVAVQSHSSRRSHQQSSLSTSSKSREAGGKLKLAEFARIYGNSLPLRISVVEGYWGAGGR